MSDPVRLDLRRTRGDDYPEDFTFTDGDGEPSSVAGCTFVMAIDTLREPPDDTTNVAEINGSILVAVDGTFRFPQTAVAALAAGEYWYEVEMVDSDGFTRTIIEGKLTIRQDRKK